MKAKKIPVRTCVITKERFPKAELIRIVKDNTGKDASVKIVNNFIDQATQDKIKNTIQGIFESYKNTDEIKSNKNDKIIT